MNIRYLCSQKEYFDVLAAAFVNNENFDSADFQGMNQSKLMIDWLID